MIRGAIAFYGRVVDVIDRALMALMATLLGVVVVLSAVEIVGRNAFKHSSPEAVDVTLSLAILVYLVGYAVLINRDEDVTMDFLYRRFSAGVRRAIDLLTALAVLAFFVLLAFKSVKLFQLGLNSLHPVFPVPHGVVALPVVIAAVACTITALRRTLDAALACIDGTEIRHGGGHIS
ncbi:MAG: TRAP transporter small permease [Alphaproteobacteria bacterium]|nr:TRAP transporter small permease [Alphaproteobacteria bacterium]